MSALPTDFPSIVQEADGPPRNPQFWLEAEIDQNDPDRVLEPPLYEPGMVSKRKATSLDNRRRFRKPLFQREQVLRLWPPKSEPMLPVDAIPETISAIGSIEEDFELEIEAKRMLEDFRKRQIERFTWSQQRRRDWFCFRDIADQCAREKGGVTRDETVRAAAYEELQKSILAGEFERNGRSRVLYLHPKSGVDGIYEKPRLTAEYLRDCLEFYGSGSRVLVDQILIHGWLPRDLCRTWFESRSIEAPSPWFLPECRSATRLGSGASTSAEPFIDDATLAHINGTGAPGRPSKSMHLIEAEFSRRLKSGSALPVLAEESRALLAWLADEQPNAPRPTEKTVKNKIRNDHRAYRTDPKFST